MHRRKYDGERGLLSERTVIKQKSTGSRLWGVKEWSE